MKRSFTLIKYVYGLIIFAMGGPEIENRRIDTVELKDESVVDIEGPIGISELTENDFGDLEKFLNRAKDFVVGNKLMLDGEEFELLQSDVASHALRVFTFLRLNTQDSGEVDDCHFVFFARDDHGVVGFSSLIFEDGRYNGYLGVLPSMERQGIGTELFKKRIEYMKELGLTWVSFHVNNRSVGILEKLGLVNSANLQIPEDPYISFQVEVDISGFERFG